jgi:hypothetical protein
LVSSRNGILTRTKLALRLSTIVVSRPQRQGSSINSPTKVGLPLTLLPARTLPVCLSNLLTTPTTLYTAYRKLPLPVCSMARARAASVLVSAAVGLAADLAVGGRLGVVDVVPNR